MKLTRSNFSRNVLLSTSGASPSSKEGKILCSTGDECLLFVPSYVYDSLVGFFEEMGTRDSVSPLFVVEVLFFIMVKNFENDIE